MGDALPCFSVSQQPKSSAPSSRARTRDVAQGRTEDATTRTVRETEAEGSAFVVGPAAGEKSLMIRGTELLSRARVAQP